MNKIRDVLTKYVPWLAKSPEVGRLRSGGCNVMEAREKERWTSGCGMVLAREKERGTSSYGKVGAGGRGLVLPAYWWFKIEKGRD